MANELGGLRALVLVVGIGFLTLSNIVSCGYTIKELKKIEDPDERIEYVRGLQERYENTSDWGVKFVCFG